MMTKGEVSKQLNAILEALDALESGIPPSRIHQRVSACRDNAMLIALDLGLPFRPVTPAPEQKKTGEEGEALATTSE